MDFQQFCFYLEIIGTISFSASGTFVGIRKRMDVFGNLALAIITAVGGGMLRDMLLGIAPPLVLQKPFCFMVAVATSIVLMIFFYFKDKMTITKFLHIYSRMLLVSDTIGLGIFTVLGINVAISVGYGDNVLIMLLVGMLTGVGGGMLRDVLARDIPMIFTQNIYAVSTLVGGAVYIFARSRISEYAYCVIIGLGVVLIIRLISETYKINLPIIE